MMKTKMLLALPIIMALASCTKTEETMAPGSDGTGQRVTSTSNNNGNIGPVPSSFTQKVLIESFTSASNPNGPENDLKIRNAISTWPTQVIATSFHVQDAMDGTPTHEVLSLVNGGSIPTLPGVMQNRLIYGGKLINDDMTWDSNLPSSLAATPNIGLAIQTSTNGYSVQANVHVGFNSDQSGNWKLVTYVTRNNVIGTGQGYDQSNGSNTNPASPFFSQGDPIPGYRHNFVATKVLTPEGGTSIPAGFMTTGGHFIESMNFDVRSANIAADLTVVAFVYDATDNFIINVQQVPVGTTQDWD